MRTIKLSNAFRPLSEYASELDDGMVVFTGGRGKPVAALVSLKNVDRESLSLSANPEFLGILERSRREFAAGKTLTLAEMRARLAARRKVAGGRRSKRQVSQRRSK